MNDNELSNVEFSSQGSLDAFVNGEQIIDTDYKANFSDGVLALETSTNGVNETKKIDVHTLLEESSRKESLKTILAKLLEEK